MFQKKKLTHRRYIHCRQIKLLKNIRANIDFATGFIFKWYVVKQERKK